ncbi:MAG: VOC family protein [Bacteroidota bacterium]
MNNPIVPYLTFHGNCREAMNFYKKCIGGKITFQTIEQSPLANKLPKEMKNCILHAALVNDKLSILASDMVEEKGLHKSTKVSLLINCSSEREIKKLYEKLSEGGEKTHPLQTSFWGALFGDLTDKFGVQWLLHLPQITTKK